MYSAREVAAWVMNAPDGNIVTTITTSATHDLPRDLGELVQLLNDERYIHAMWKRKLEADRKPVWTWHLQRRRRKATNDVMQAMIQHAIKQARLRDASANDE